MKPPIVSESDALKAARKSGTWKTGWYGSRIDTARETLSNAGNECFECTHNVRNAAGDERIIRDRLTATNFGLLKLKHAIEAVGCSEKYNAGEELTQEDFAGADVEVKLGIEKKRGFPDRNIIQDHRAAASSVVNLRTVAKAVAFVGGVSLAALSTACSSVPGSSMPVRYAAAPAYYGYQQAAYQPPQQSYAAPRYNPATRRFEWRAWRTGLPWVRLAA